VRSHNPQNNKLMKKLLALSAALLVMAVSFAQGPHADGKMPRGKKARAAYEQGYRTGYSQGQFDAQRQYAHGGHPHKHGGKHKGQHHGHGKHGQCQHGGGRGQR
jgi:hypothetical protein